MPTADNPKQFGNAESLEQILETRALLHELSNVLTGVLVTAGLLKNFVPLSGSGERYASDLEQSGDRSARLVEQIRTKIHRLQELEQSGMRDSTNVCDVRPSLGQRTGEH